jgi:hypothetical protein
MCVHVSIPAVICKLLIVLSHCFRRLLQPHATDGGKFTAQAKNMCSRSIWVEDFNRGDSRQYPRLAPKRSAIRSNASRLMLALRRDSHNNIEAIIIVRTVFIPKIFHKYPVLYVA